GRSEAHERQQAGVGGDGCAVEQVLRFPEHRTQFAVEAGGGLAAPPQVAGQDAYLLRVEAAERHQVSPPSCRARSSRAVASAAQRSASATSASAISFSVRLRSERVAVVLSA